MADGVRIQLTAERRAQYPNVSWGNRMIVVRDVTRPLPPTACRICAHPHDCKTYHLKLEADGTVIVSTTIWDNMRKLFDHGGFEEVNVVGAPPAQGIILPTAKVSITPAKF